MRKRATDGATMGDRLREAPLNEVVKEVDASDALAKSLRDGDAVIMVHTPDGIARKVIKRVRQYTFSSGLTASERDFLGSELSTEEPPLEQDPMILGERDFCRLLENSLSISQVAAALGKTEGRIRQRLTEPRTLLGVRTGRGWRVPIYQFWRKGRRLGLIPGLEVVIPKLDPSLHPVSVFRWLMSKNSELESESEIPLSPLEWLRAGGPPSAVAELASEL